MLRLRSLLLLLFSHLAHSMLLGWVESPGYPSGYLPHASSNWSRCAPIGHILSIRLIHLDLEDSKDCENDAVKVFSNGNLISVLCGKKEFEELQANVNPSLTSSSGGCLSLSFESDYSNVHRHTGFRGFYTVQDTDYDECEDDPDNQCTQFCHNFIGGYYCSCRHGYHLDKDKHTCTENANCWYTLSVEAHLQLELHFSEVFDVEQSPDGQCIDTLKIETPSGTLGPFCGHTPPPSPYLTHSHKVKIHFTSDGFGSNKGFTFHFQTRDKVCLADVIPHSTVTPQKPEYRPGEKVTVTCDLGYFPNTKGVNAFSSEYVTSCHSTGIWVPHFPCEPVDCGFPNIPEDGILKLVGDNPQTQYEDQILFTCNSNYYTLEGNGKDSCQFDSGGPFVLPMLSSSQRPFYLTGIVSWGSPCQEKKYKGYYTKVENYVDWIKETIDKWIHSLTDLFNAEMGWTVYFIWFLYVTVCECKELPVAEPAMYGEVKSPEYPKPYPPDLLAQWDISVPEGYQIRLTFTHMDIEPSPGCFYDALTVHYDGKVVGRFCGHENSDDGHHPGNQPILYPDNHLTLIFQTDNYNPERHQNVGFSAQYQAIVSCGGGIFDEPEGHLLSPGYPNPPPHGVSCQYVISVEKGFTVTLNFSDFHIESVDTDRGRTCLHHWLEVTVPGRDPMKLCGTESPGLLNTNSNTVQLDYHTDNEGLSNGWSLDYSTYRVNCPLPGKIAKGRVTPSSTEYLYRDYIFVRCDQGYKLMMDGKEIASFSTMCQSNGQWHLPLPECHIIDCGEPETLLNGRVTFLSGFQNQYRSVVQYQCNEPFYSLLVGDNVTFTCEADRKWRSDSDVVVSPTCIPVCGKPTKLISEYQRIIGGNEAPENTIPWQVLLSIDGARGGGMVIADRWIMTAAHNVVENEKTVSNDTIRIFMGLTDVNTDLTPGVYAASVHVHPEYNNPTSVDYSNDIALIKLHEPITFDSFVMPICLPPEDATYHTGTMGLVSGFGIIKVDGKDFLKNKLQYVRLPLVNQETCSNSITLMTRGKDNVPILTNNMFCAGFPEGGKDSCQGDSGGPFALHDNEQFWAAGIVSWGFECGKRGTYGVYTKVANYLSWISKTMQEN
ncbi:Complement C1r subcomponent [Channa argus]|uniref:complement subcomponent C1r n=1 Tax=Channa argus TaxID=215402 RepID=A0A6G1PPG6_CHAAH|nr:Complement C1r subcomponent [Channa argus]